MTDTTTPRFPDVTVQLTGQDGNAFLIVGRVSAALRNGGATREEVTEFRNEASGDYNNVLRTALAWVNVE